MSSRLFTEVRERRGLCYSISASHQSLEDTGMLVISSGLKKTAFREAIEVIEKELKKTREKLLAPDEIKRAKDHVRGKLMLSLEDSANQAEWYGKQWMFQKKFLSPEARLKQIEAVTAHKIKQVANHIFHPQKMARAVIGPYKSKTEVEQYLKMN